MIQHRCLLCSPSSCSLIVRKFDHREGPILFHRESVSGGNAKLKRRVLDNQLNVQV